ncbi:MAG: hypothetical protein L6R48_12555 [Planctomycetes bacterium]|nr:hypothetical protein [Planctomycetota bacterium]
MRPLLPALLLGLLTAAEPATTAVILSGSTSKPERNVFIAGEAVTLRFEVRGLPPGREADPLQLDIVDEDDRAVASQRLPVRADADGGWSASVPAPAGRLGFYRARVRLGAATLPRLVSRPAGYLTYAVVGDPATRPLLPPGESLFGLQGSTWPGLAACLGFRWTLANFRWGELAGKRPEGFPARRDEAIAAGRRLPATRPADLLPDGRPWTLYPIATRIVQVDPAWKVLAPGTEAHGHGRLTAEGEELFAAHCRSLAAAWAADERDLPEHLYEVTWEPVHPWGFKGEPQDLARVYAIAHRELHAGDARARVIGPCLADAPVVADYERLHAHRLFDHVDGISFHPYIALPPEPNGLVERMRALRTWMRDRLGRELPLYATEQGYSTGEQEAKELLQAQGLVRGQLIMIGEGCRLSFGFYTHDYIMGNERGYGYQYNLDPRQNWNPAVTGPKPVLPAFAAMTRLIDGHRPVQAIDWLGDTAMGYAYQRGEQVVLALWDWGGRPRPVDLPMAGPAVQVHDWMGNPRPAALRDGLLHLDLGPAPLYVTGVPARLWGAGALRPLTPAATRVDGFPGAPLTIAAELHSDPDAGLEGVLTLVPDPALGLAPVERSLRLAPGQRSRIDLELGLPIAAEPGPHPLNLLLTVQGRVVAGAGVLLTVRAPVVVAAVGSTFADGTAALQVTLQERQGRPAQGRVQLVVAGVPEGRLEAPFTLAAGATGRVLLRPAAALDVDALRTYRCSVAVLREGLPALRSEHALCFARAARLPRPPVHDGRLGGWEAVPAWNLHGRSWAVRKPERCRGRDDLAVSLRYGWDAQHLHLAAVVRDDAHCQPYDGFPTWKADCLQIAIDLDAGRSIELTGNELIDAGRRARVTEIDFALTPLGPQAYRTVSCRPALPAGLIPPTDLPLAITRTALTGGGVELVYEASIPWRLLGGEAPRAGDEIGIAGTVNDIDEAAEQEPWALGWFTLKDPARFGRLVLAP